MTRFDQIACVSIVVDSIEDTLPLYTEGLGLDITGARRASKRGFGMDWVELGRDGRTFLELIEATSSDGPIAKFLGNGPVSRLYQTRFLVDDVEETLNRLEERGLAVVRGQVVPGEQNVGWVHPRSTGGALIELVSRSAAPTTTAEQVSEANEG